jgi:tight adherence protein B
MGFFKLNASTEYALGMSAVFVMFFLLASAVYHLAVRPLLWQRDLERRLSGQRTKLQKVQIFRAVAEADKSVVLIFAQRLVGWPKVENLRRSLLQADLYWTTTTFLSVAGILFSVGLMGGMLQDNTAIGIVIGLFLGGLPFLYVRIKKNKKTKLFEAQMPESMELLARSMRAGHTLPSAIEMAGREMADPLGTEMKVVYEEQRLGLGLQAALARMGERVDSRDLQYFITAVTLQAETGGNLAEMMENLGYLIRERLKLKGKIQALTAEGRFSAIILSCLPIGLFCALALLNPSYVRPFFDEPIGGQMLVGGVVGMFLGFIWMRQIIQIKV